MNEDTLQNGPVTTDTLHFQRKEFGCATGCGKLATHRPVLLVQPKRHRGAPAEVEMEIGVCAEHRAKPGLLLTPEVWTHILGLTRKRGWKPHRGSTGVRYVELPPLTGAEVLAWLAWRSALPGAR